MSIRLPAETSVLASSRQKSMNRNFSRAEKYSLSRRKPENERAGQGKSASSGAKPTACSASGGRSTGRASAWSSARATERVWASNSSNSVEPRSPPRKKRSRSRPSWVNVMAGLTQRRLMRRQGTAPAAGRVGGRGRGHARQPDRVDLHRPERQGIGRAKQAGLAADRLRFDREAGRQMGGARHSPVGGKPADRHRGDGGQVV